ncbi:MAG: YhbY family RNA-binding protein [Methanobacteriota archaeon]
MLTRAGTAPGKRKADLRRAGQDLDVAFHVGKHGVTDGVVAELQERLEREPLTKVRFLPASRAGMEANALAADLAARAGAELIEVRGHTALFYRPLKGKKQEARTSKKRS